MAALIALAIALPHLVWLVENDFLPFRYAEARAAPVRGLIDHVLHPLAFVVGQILWLLPVRADRAAAGLAAAAGSQNRRSTRSTAASSRCSRSARRRC